MPINLRTRRGRQRKKQGAGQTRVSAVVRPRRNVTDSFYVASTRHPGRKQYRVDGYGLNGIQTQQLSRGHRPCDMTHCQGNRRDVCCDGKKRRI